jgi:hypothetical protein
VPTPITFHIYQGGQLVRSETLAQDVIKIGKLDSMHLKLEDEGVSRMHAVIETAPTGEVFLTDLGSATGSIVNGQRQKKVQLRTADQLQFGSTVIAIELGDAGEYAGSAEGEYEEQTPARAPTARSLKATQLGTPPASQQGQLPTNPFGAPAAQSGMTGGFGAAGYGQPAAYSAHAQHANTGDEGQSDPEHPYVPPQEPGHDYGSQASQQGHYGQEYDDQYGSHDHGEELEGMDNVVYQLIPQTAPVNPSEIDGTDAAIEIVILWGELSILHVAHLSPPRPFYVGEAKDAKGKLTTDFLIGSESIGTERLPIIVPSGGGVAVVVAPDAVGDVTIGNDTMSMEDLLAQGQLQPSSELPGAYQYPLPAGATARVMYRGFTFVVKPMVAARPVGVGQANRVDWKSYTWTFVSIGLHAALLLLFYFRPPDSSSLSLDLLNADSRLVKYLIEPPETVEEEQPEWLTENKEDDEGGQGKRAKDEEGQMGKKDEQKTKNKFGIEGPQDNKDPHMAREEAKEAAANAGIIGTLKAMTGAWNSPTSPYGRDSAEGNDAMSALGALMGDQVGGNFGFGGLGLRGTGRGGGGTGEGTIGLGNVGTIGHGAGGGTGSGYGSGAGGFRGRDAKVPRIRSGQADVHGSLSKEVIRRIIGRHINEVRFCYEQELNSRPDIQGRISIKFIIAPTGAVQNALVDSSDMGAPKVEQCIAQSVRRWTFPAPEGGGIVVVTYPFVLQQTGG